MAFRTISRIVAIVLGIASAVLIARDGYKIALNEYLDAIIDLYDDWFVKLAMISVEPLIHAALAQLRSWFEWDLSLYSHWKYAFILLWMFFRPAAHALTQSYGKAFKAFGWIWGGVWALIGGVLAGVVPLSHPSIFWTSVASAALYAVGIVVWRERTDLEGYYDFPFDVAAALVIVCGAPLIGGFIFGGFASSTLSPGLTRLIVTLVFVGIFCLATAREGDRPDKALTQLGLDILSILGGAATIVYIGHLLA